MATKKQLAKIHCLKKDRGLTEEEYRAALGSFGTGSSKDLTIADADKFIGKLEGRPEGKKFVKRYPGRPGAGSYFASAKQLRKIEMLWQHTARDKSAEAMNKFIRNRSGVDHLTFLPRAKASSIIYILEKMAAS